MSTNTYTSDGMRSFRTSWRAVRTKSDWAGVSLGDALNTDIDFYRRISAQRKLDGLIRAVQRAVHQHVAEREPTDSYLVKPQLSPFHTTYPATLAAFAAVGLTGYLEFTNLVADNALLGGFMHEYLDDPASADQVTADPDYYKRLAGEVAKVVETRLVLMELAQLPGSSAVEVYRLFAAAIKDLNAPSVREIVAAIVLYGDVIPDPVQYAAAWQAFHPGTVAIAEVVATTSRPFQEALDGVAPAQRLAHGRAWSRAICLALARFLPEKNTEQEPREDKPLMRGEARKRRPRARESLRFVATDERDKAEDHVAPLGGPHAPHLFDEPSVLRAAGARAADEPVIDIRQGSAGAPSEVLQTLADTLKRALDVTENWEQPQSDFIEQLIAGHDFEPGPIEGAIVSGHEVRVELGGSTEVGQIHDRPVAPSENALKVQALRAASEPITKALRKALYPNIERVPEDERFRSAGVLDGARLPLANMAEAVFKRSRHVDRLDRRGRSVVLIICDGSGSLGAAPTRVLKLLTAGWVESTLGSTVRVLAGVYHDTAIRRGLSGPVIEWLVNPEMNLGHREALRSVAALPAQGRGGQSDALSIAYLLDEAVRLARGARIYATLISDLNWVKSFNGAASAEDEVVEVVRQARVRLGEQLHLTLVALGENKGERLRPIVDHTIAVAENDFDDVAKVAGEIATWVAQSMRRHDVIGR